MDQPAGPLNCPMSEDHTTTHASIWPSSVGGPPVSSAPSTLACAVCRSRSLTPSKSSAANSRRSIRKSSSTTSAAFRKVLAKDLAQALIEQAGQYKPAICLGERVEGSNAKEPAAYLVYIRRHNIIEPAPSSSPRASGPSSPRRCRCPRPSVSSATDSTISSRTCRRSRNKRVLIVGGGDSAVDWANTGLTHRRVLHAHPSPRRVPRPRAERRTHAQRAHENPHVLRAEGNRGGRSDRRTPRSMTIVPKKSKRSESTPCSSTSDSTIPSVRSRNGAWKSKADRSRWTP